MIFYDRIVSFLAVIDPNSFGLDIYLILFGWKCDFMLGSRSWASHFGLDVMKCPPDESVPQKPQHCILKLSAVFSTPLSIMKLQSFQMLSFHERIHFWDLFVQLLVYLVLRCFVILKLHWQKRHLLRTLQWLSVGYRNLTKSDHARGNFKQKNLDEFSQGFFFCWSKN